MNNAIVTFILAAFQLKKKVYARVRFSRHTAQSSRFARIKCAAHPRRNNLDEDEACMS
jgi:hypothetical protein